MNHHDLLELKENIYSLGETISQQEGFYRDVNGFLRQVYPTAPNPPLETSRISSRSFKNCWATPSAGGQTNRTSALNL